MLAVAESHERMLHMHGMRRGDVNHINAGIGQHLFITPEMSAEPKLTGKLLCPAGITRTNSIKISVGKQHQRPRKFVGNVAGAQDSPVVHFHTLAFFYKVSHSSPILPFARVISLKSLQKIS